VYCCASREAQPGYWHDPHIKHLAKPVLNHVESDTAPRTVAIRRYLHPRTNVRKVPLKQINVHKTVLRNGNLLPSDRQRDFKSVPTDHPRGRVAIAG
jgi:hypothetical protein